MGIKGLLPLIRKKAAAAFERDPRAIRAALEGKGAAVDGNNHIMRLAFRDATTNRTHVARATCEWLLDLQERYGLSNVTVAIDGPHCHGKATWEAERRRKARAADRRLLERREAKVAELESKSPEADLEIGRAHV